MGIRFACHGCGRRLNIKSSLAGKRASCPGCQLRFRIPWSDAISSIPISPDEPPELPGEKPTVADIDSAPVPQPLDSQPVASFVSTIKDVKVQIGEHLIEALQRDGTVGVLSTVVVGKDGLQRIVSASLGPDRIALVHELVRLASVESKRQRGESPQTGQSAPAPAN